MAFLPQLQAVPGVWGRRALRDVIIVFGFFFSVVSSRITGELGSSSNPMSGMAIATLMGACLIFVPAGLDRPRVHRGRPLHRRRRLHRLQQRGHHQPGPEDELPGRRHALEAAGRDHRRRAHERGRRSAATLQVLNRRNARMEEARYAVSLPPAAGGRREAGPDGATYRVARVGGGRGSPTARYLVDAAGQVRYRVQEGIGSGNTPAPQATLMSLVTKGILTRQLPWGLVLLGVFTSMLMEIIGVPALAFAVGMYLPLESTTPVFLGGLVRKLVDWKRGSAAESDAGPGVLYSSGLVAGGSILGLLASFLADSPSSRVPVLGAPGHSAAARAGRSLRSSASRCSSASPTSSIAPRSRAADAEPAATVTARCEGRLHRHATAWARPRSATTSRAR